MKRAYLYLYGVVLAVAALLAPASLHAAPSTLDSLNLALSRSTTTLDSIRLLSDIFDVSEIQQQQVAAGTQIIALAERIHDDATKLQFVREMAAQKLGADTLLPALIDIAAAMPPSADRSETLALLQVRLAAMQEPNMSNEERRQNLQRALSNYGIDGNDIYTNVRDLLTVCIYLGSDTQSDLLTDYYDLLQPLVEKLPHSRTESLRAYYYDESSRAYTYNEESSRAIRSCENHLHVISHLDSIYNERKRAFHSFDFNRYRAYRRLLQNYVSLPKEQVQQYYDAVLQLAARNSQVYDDFHNNERATIYYLMSMHRYAEALKILQRQVDRPENAVFRTYLLRSMIEAAKDIDDHETLLWASLQYNQALEERIRNKTSERSRELEIIYDVADLRSQNDRLEIEKRDAQNTTTRVIVMALAALLLLLIIVSVCIITQFRRSRRHSRLLTKDNDELRRRVVAQRKRLDEAIKLRDEATDANTRKSDFIVTLSHEIGIPISAIAEYARLIVDCMDDESRRYMSRYADIVVQNVEMVTRIAGEINEGVSTNRELAVATYAPMSVGAVCLAAVDSVTPVVKPDVQVTFARANATDISIIADRARLGQVLYIMMDNAAKFTERGSITLDYKVDEAADTITFIVTDTGIGVPADKAEQIFKRYVKLNKFADGLGLGLSIGRSVATMMHGTLTLDNTYTEGARFTFTIPMHPATEE